MRCTPNPGNANFNIILFISQPGDYQIDIYNSSGQKTFTSRNTYLGCGNQGIAVDAKEFASGVYFCQIQGMGIVMSGKIILNK
jgi:hypothetical protein